MSLEIKFEQKPSVYFESLPVLSGFKNGGFNYIKVSNTLGYRLATENYVDFTDQTVTELETTIILGEK